jgi:hypothetical protein
MLQSVGLCGLEDLPHCGVEGVWAGVHGVVLTNTGDGWAQQEDTFCGGGGGTVLPPAGR